MVQDFSDTQSLLPCKRCAELLQEGDRFCRYCGQDQFEPDVDVDVDDEPLGTPSARTAFGGAKALLPLAPESRSARGRSARKHALRTDMEIKPDLAFPGAVWQRQANGRAAADAPRDWSNRSIAPSRLTLGVAAALLLLMIFVLLHDLYVEWQAGAAGPQSLKQNVEQVQGALKDAIDKQIQELTDERDRLRAATGSAPDAQPLPAPVPESEPAAPARPEQSAQVEPPAQAEAPAQAQAPAQAEPTAQAEPPAAPAAQLPSPEETPAPAPAPAAAPPDRSECNEALAALSLCPNR